MAHLAHFADAAGSEMADHLVVADVLAWIVWHVDAGGSLLRLSLESRMSCFIVRGDRGKRKHAMVM